MPDFQAEFLLPQTVEVVFEFHSNTANLLRMIPQENKPELLEGPAQLSSGAEFELKVSTFGLAQLLRFKVIDFADPHKIASEQLKGPFRSWRETHHFESVNGGGTRLLYRVDFEPPGGMLGFVVTSSRVIEHLQKLWPYRQQRTLELLEGK